MGEGKSVGKVLVEEASSVRKELYLSFVVDRSRGKECVVFTALERAGVVVEKNPAEIGKRVQEILKAT
jgi:succinyl-CoA synthetase beta subunit